MSAFTVPTETCQASFAWNGVQNAFACGFPALSQADLLVQYASGAGASFTATIAGGVMNVSAIAAGALAVGSVLTTGALAGTTIVGLGSGAGGIGTYIVSPAQVVANATAMNAAAQNVTLVAGVNYTVALDPLAGIATITPIAMPDDGPGIVTVTRATPAIQEQQFSALSNYDADSFTGGFDAAMMAIAEVKRRTAALETVAFGASPAPAPNAIAVPAQRAILVGGQLPIRASDQILNIAAAADLTPALPLAATRGGLPLTIKLLPGCHAQTVMRTGNDLIDGNAAFPLAALQRVTFWPYDDGTNSGWGL